ncbi:MAG: hypothetical protein EZS28_041647 [Streblomastix strix]|uniref:non-specific serine/threonine protein kinase n=1 Tax=Streblomastix strix TaxID=222440 RepID=A0A5J4TWI0_9EUKA|nr:MAG: hypothetical protein EZS28_041647 [Streblomastix strix]
MAVPRRADRIIQFGEYFVKQKFGAGSMSKTYLVEKGLQTSNLFILKIVNYFAEEEIETADAEIAQMQRLESPYTVRLICTFQDRDNMCIVLEFCQNGDLRKVIADLQKLPEAERLMV